LYWVQTVQYLWFWFAFPECRPIMLSIFSCGLLDICISSLEKHLFKFFPHFSNWVVCFLLLSCRSLLYILYTSTLSDIWFANILSLFVHCLFAVFLVSLDAQKFLTSLWSNLVIFILFPVLFLVISKKSLPNPVLWRFFFLFSSNSVILLDLKFRSLIDLKL